jgi:chitinase
MAATAATSFSKALANGQLDKENGGEWYWDSTANLFWTWDTPELIEQKVAEIVQGKGIGGVMAWSLGEDAKDGRYLAALRKAYLKAAVKSSA